MKNGPLFVLGLFLALAVSFAGMVLGSHGQLGSLTPYFDDVEVQAHPSRSTGLGSRGQMVYADLGCAACHTQGVRRPDFGSDKARGWGDRQSVARDFIHQSRPQVGSLRVGPDLTTFGRRAGKSADEATVALDRFLFEGSASHPSYKFLFETSKVTGERSSRALPVPGLPSDLQVVPSERARTLVSYLIGLNTAYDYPESRPYVAASKGEQKK